MEISKNYFLDILFLTTMAVVTQFLIIFPLSLVSISLGYQLESDEDREILIRENKTFKYENLITKFVF